MVKSPDGFWASADELAAAYTTIATLTSKLAEAERDALGPLTDDLIAILGRPNFQCAGIAELLRIRGDDIKHKSESEQAAAIHFLLGFYLKHGPEWAIVAGAELKRLSEIRDEAIADAARGVKA